MIETAQSLIAYCGENNRVCPMPVHWAAMYDLLPLRDLADGRTEPAVPLILGGWDSPILFKMARLAEQINWAEQHGCLPEVSAFLRSLKEADWYHLRD